MTGGPTRMTGGRTHMTGGQTNQTREGINLRILPTTNGTGVKLPGTTPIPTQPTTTLPTTKQRGPLMLTSGGPLHRGKSPTKSNKTQCNKGKAFQPKGCYALVLADYCALESA